MEAAFFGEGVRTGWVKAVLIKSHRAYANRAQRMACEALVATESPPFCATRVARVAGFGKNGVFFA